MYDFGLGHHWLNPQGTFKVFCKANKGLCLAVRDGALVLAAPDPTDEHQHWFKDIRFSLRIKDTEGKPVFSLVNKATGLAVQHSLGLYNRVRLVKFNPEDFDESVLWTESSHLGRDFSHIRMMHNINLGLHALPGDEEGGGRVQDGTTIVIMEWDESDNQSWKILSWKDEDNTILGGLEAEPTCRIYCKAYKGFSVTVRNGIVCLAPTNFNDKFQQWIEDKRPGNMIKDMEGYPAFTVINRATGDAIEASLGKGNPTIRSSRSSSKIKTSEDRTSNSLRKTIITTVRSIQKTSRISRRMSPSHLPVLKKISLLLYRRLLIRLRHSVL